MRPHRKDIFVDKITIAKKLVSVAVGFGTSCIVKGIIEHNVDATTPASKVSVAVAGFAIGGVVAEASSNYTDELIESVVELWQKAVSDYKNKTAE
jgi:hypothetical protein